MRFEGRTALVTGAARGIGQAIARRLASEGARVCVVDRDYERASATAREIVEAGGVAHAIACDVADEASVVAAVAQARERFGGVDILVNNAGVAPHVIPVVDYPLEEWERHMNVNLKGTFLCCKHVAPLMMERERGKIVNISSINGLSGPPLVAAYNASKWGVIGFSKTLANELAPYHINVNVVCPGPTDTEFHSVTMPERARILGISEAEVRERIRQSVPLGRWTRPEDVAAAVAFLASDDADHITGEVLPVTGGMAGVGGVAPRRK